MAIPYVFNRLGIGDFSTSITPQPDSYGVFTFDHNGNATSSAMSMTNAPLTYYGNAYQKVWSQGVALGTIITTDCCLYVYQGGKASGAIARSQGNIQISAKGYVLNAEIKPGASMEIFADGSANGIYCSESARMSVYQGAHINHVTLDSTSMVISGDQTVATNIFLNSGASLKVSSAHVSSIAVSSAASVGVYQSGSVADVNLASGAQMYLNQGCAADDIYYASGAIVNIPIHGYDSKTRITGSGYRGGLSLSNGIASGFDFLGSRNSCGIGYGASALDCFYYSSAYLYVDGGALASGCSVKNASMGIQSDGLAVATQISSGAILNIYQYGIAQDTIVHSGGSEYVSNGGSSLRTHVKMGGVEYLGSRSFCESAQISSGGSLMCGSVCTINALVLYPGAYMDDPAVITDLSRSIHFAGSGYVHFADNIVISVGNHVSGDVLSSGHSQYVIDNDVAISTLILDGANQIVTKSGTVTESLISGGYQYVKSGGVAISTIINSGMQYISSGGEAYKTIISKGNQYVSSNAIISGTTIFAGSQYVTSTLVDDTEIFGGMQIINKNASARNTRVYSGGVQRVAESGFAENTIVYNSGSQVASGGVVSTLLSGGTLTINSGASVDGVDVFSDGFLSMGHYASARNINIYSGGSQQTGGMDTVVESTTIFDSGFQELDSGNYTASTFISGGTQNVTNSSLAEDTDVFATGVQRITWHGSASNTRIYSGGLQILENGSAFQTTIFDGGIQEITHSHAYVDSTVISSGGIQIISVEYAIVRHTEVLDGGEQHILPNAGEINMTNIHSGGCLRIDSNAEAYNISLASGGSLCIQSGGTASIAESEEGAVINAEEGAVIEYIN